MSELATRRIYALYDERGVSIYQAFKPSIVQAALARGTFGAGFSLDRMTWIKPSFGWMLHRSNYATSHRQEAIVRVRLAHEGFLAILAQAVPTSYDRELYASEREWSLALDASEVRYQWDPERDPRGFKLERRAIQLGIRGATVRRYVEEWIVEIEDVTPLARAVGEAARRGAELPPLPEERELPLPDELRRRLRYD